MLKNEMLVNQILEIINTLIEASQHLYNCACEKMYIQLEATAEDMINMIETIYPITKQIKMEVPFISSTLSCENLLFSVKNIMTLVRTRSERVCSKIEFELIPILQDFYYDFYFYTCIFGDKDKEREHYEKEYGLMIGNHYIDEAIKTDSYKYDVSICVLAFNKLDYTKMCIENIIKFTPNYINYELILLNNGSTDDTLQYFESLAPTKLFSLKHNSLNIMAGASSRIIEGKYSLAVSNDVLVTENYLDNLLKCIKSDPKIAMVAPSTPNVSNHQAVNGSFSSFEEMHTFAKSYNVSNELLWEERTRLCNPISLISSEALLSSKGVGTIDKYFIYGEFGDDALALRIRRSGYKMILAKDCFCYHFGSVTLKEAQVKENTLDKSRKLFIDRYGVDAWGTGVCYDFKINENLTYRKEGLVNILGVNSGFGSNPLKVKTLLKEESNIDANLFFITDNNSYIQDLNGLSENVEYSPDNQITAFKHVEFDYILIEGNIDKIINNKESFERIKNRLTIGGTLAVGASKDTEAEMLSAYDPIKTVNGDFYRWYLWRSED